MEDYLEADPEMTGLAGVVPTIHLGIDSHVALHTSLSELLSMYTVDTMLEWINMILCLMTPARPRQCRISVL